MTGPYKRTYPVNFPPGNCLAFGSPFGAPAGQCGDGVCERLYTASYGSDPWQGRTPGGDFEFDRLPAEVGPGGDHLQAFGMPHEPNVPGEPPKPNGDQQFQVNPIRQIWVARQGGSARIQLLDVTVTLANGQQQTLHLGYQFRAGGEGNPEPDVVALRAARDIANPLDPDSISVEYQGLYDLTVQQGNQQVTYTVKAKDELNPIAPAVAK